MIAYNYKYCNTKKKTISTNQTIRKRTSHPKKKITEENKRFLKLIGLLK